MCLVKFTGWEEGAEKLSFIKMLAEIGGFPFKEAKDIKDRIVDNDEVVTIEVEEKKVAQKIVTEALLMGFTAELICK